MTNEEAEDLAKRLGLRFYRSCVKESLNVTEGELKQHNSKYQRAKPIILPLKI